MVAGQDLNLRPLGYELVKRRPGLCHRCHNVLVRRHAAMRLGIRRPAPSKLFRRVPLALALSLGCTVASTRTMMAND